MLPCDRIARVFEFNGSARMDMIDQGIEPLVRDQLADLVATSAPALDDSS